MRKKAGEAFRGCSGTESWAGTFFIAGALGKERAGHGKLA